MLEFLSPAEIRALTGSRIHRLQQAWLIDRRWPHETDRHGRPRVLREEAARRLSSAAPARQTAGPRLEVVR